VDVDLEVTEGTLAHVHEIAIAGNTKTEEKVIRRQLRIAPGDEFVRPKPIRSLREIFSLGYFEGPPEVDTRPLPSGDIDLTLKVKEKTTGEFRMGAGFSQLNSVSGFLGIQENNFLGRGQRIGINWEFSRYLQNLNLQFTEPYLFDTPTELGVNVYNYTQNQIRWQFYDDRRKGVTVRIGRSLPWYDYTSIYFRYRYESIHLSNFSLGYSGPLTRIKWPQRTSSVSVTLSRNSTDSPFHPTRGSSSFLTAEFNGGWLGGSNDYQRYEAGFSWFTPLVGKLALRVSAQFGVLDGYRSPDQVPDYELFRLGGNRRYGLRGYDFYEIVPEGNPAFTGGRFMEILTYEVTYPLSPTVYAVFFFDAGNTWNSFSGADLLDLKKGVGPGIRVELPMLGTFGIDYGYGFDKEGGAGWELHFTLGSGFF
jgi:outer membrane protein insertion porin family